MNKALAFIAVPVLGILSGCNKAHLFTLDFEKNQTLRYEFTSSRDTVIDWEPAKSGSDKRIDKFLEKMKMVVAYTPIEVNPYGFSTIEAKCESVRVTRSGSKASGKDAVESLAGKSFTLKVNPAGKIEDYSGLKQLIHEAGEKAFRKDGVKEPDMIGDFIAIQWFLWDLLSSIEKPEQGLLVGQSWRSQLSIPMQIMLKKARDVTYTLEDVNSTEEGQIASIGSQYSLGGSEPRSWPVPYSRSFQMTGTFGFFGWAFKGLKITELQGEGEVLFNIDKGRIEQNNQQYQMQLKPVKSGVFGVNPVITIKQNLSMKLLAEYDG